MELLKSASTTFTAIGSAGKMQIASAGTFLSKTVTADNAIHLIASSQKGLGYIARGMHSGLCRAGREIANYTRPIWDRTTVSVIRNGHTITTTYQAEAIRKLHSFSDKTIQVGTNVYGKGAELATEAKNAASPYLAKAGQGIVSLISQAQSTAAQVFPQIAKTASARVHPLVPASCGTVAVGMIPFAFPILASLYNGYSRSSELKSFNQESRETWKNVRKLSDSDEITAELTGQRNRLQTAIENRKSLAQRRCYALTSKNVTAYITIGGTMLTLAPQLTLATMATVSIGALGTLLASNLWNSYQNSHQVGELETIQRAFTGEISQRSKLVKAKDTIDKLQKEVDQFQHIQGETTNALEQYKQEAKDREEKVCSLEAEKEKLQKDCEFLKAQLSQKHSVTVATQQNSSTVKPVFKRSHSLDLSVAQNLSPLIFPVSTEGKTEISTDERRAIEGASQADTPSGDTNTPVSPIDQTTMNTSPANASDEKESTEEKVESSWAVARAWTEVWNIFTGSGPYDYEGDETRDRLFY